MFQLHYCISGFTQSAARTSGMLNLCEHLHDDGFSAGRESRVYLHPWHSDWSTIAEHAWLLSQRYDALPSVGIYGYSWGAGHGAITLAGELEERGISVRAMVLCDPVPRPWLPMRWTAMLPAKYGRPIRIPANVVEAWSLYQRMNLPQGHRVVPASPATTVHPPLEVHATHQYADDVDAFHVLARQAARCVSAETR